MKISIERSRKYIEPVASARKLITPSIRDSFVMTYAAMAWHFRDVDFASQIAIFVNMTQYRNRKRHDVSLDEAAGDIQSLFGHTLRHARFVFRN